MSMIARILITVRTPPGVHTDVDVREIERQLAEAARRWEDDCRTHASNPRPALGTEATRTTRSSVRYGRRLPMSYREDVAPRNAVADCRNDGDVE